MSWYLSQFIRFALQRYYFFPNYAIVGTTFLLSKRNILQFSLFQNAIFYNFHQFKTRYFTILLRQLSRHLMSVLRYFSAILCRLKPNFPLFYYKIEIFRRKLSVNLSMSKIIRTFAVAKVLATALCMAVPRKGVCADTRGWDCRHILGVY